MQEKCMIWHLGFCEVSFWKEKKEDCWLMEKALPTLEFKKFTDFPRGTMYDLLCDAYSYDDRNKKICDSNWKKPFAESKSMKD